MLLLWLGSPGLLSPGSVRVPVALVLPHTAGVDALLSMDCRLLAAGLPFIAGINRSRVEDMEARLKRDVLREAARYDQHILVTEEDDDMNVRLLQPFLCQRMLLLA